MDQLKKEKQHKDDKVKKLYDYLIETICKIFQEINNIFKNLHNGSFVVSFNKLNDLTFKDLKYINWDKNINLNWTKTKDKEENNTDNEENNTKYFKVLETDSQIRRILFSLNWEFEMAESIDTFSKKNYNENLFSKINETSLYYSKNPNIYNLTFLDFKKHLNLYLLTDIFKKRIETFISLKKVTGILDLPYDFVEDKYIGDPSQVKLKDKDLINKIRNVPLKIIDKFPYVKVGSTPEERRKTHEELKKLLGITDSSSSLSPSNNNAIKNQEDNKTGNQMDSSNDNKMIKTTAIIVVLLGCLSIIAYKNKIKIFNSKNNLFKNKKHPQKYLGKDIKKNKIIKKTTI